MHPILTGTVGSVAYGLNTDSSDVDTLGVFVHPTEAFFGLSNPAESHVTTNPDVTMHEAAKYCRLALNCNPSVLELLWLPADLLRCFSPDGVALIRMRNAFLSRKRVRNAYMGYADQQFKKLKERGDGSFSSDTRKRTAKHARHLLRLVNQGTQLHLTGELTVKVDDPEFYHTFGDRVAAGNTLYVEKVMSDAKRIFDETTSVLPDKPNTERVEQWLRTVRRHYLDRTPLNPIGC